MPVIGARPAHDAVYARRIRDDEKAQQWHCLLQVAVSGARLLARLSVVGAVARFQEAAEELARMHALNATPDSPSTQV